MYKFNIWKTSYFGFKPELLETFKTKDIKKGLNKLSKQLQSYINNGTVNDYTSFSAGELITNNKRFSVWFEFGNKVRMQVIK